jgi:hypothetical protein
MTNYDARWLRMATTCLHAGWHKQRRTESDEAPNCLDPLVCLQQPLLPVDAVPSEIELSAQMSDHLSCQRRVSVDVSRDRTDH